MLQRELARSHRGRSLLRRAGPQDSTQRGEHRRHEQQGLLFEVRFNFVQQAVDSART